MSGSIAGSFSHIAGTFVWGTALLAPSYPYPCSSNVALKRSSSCSKCSITHNRSAFEGFV
ncbi:hypothetical protein K469DRAFT_720268 [Zopfia rhizophila CBS 207.26]|uniref:Uncharacterized protein n=1 Tax=Zopfia rhizophila CBS 207.26 TaxID=1314779 RepID=A0A6A6EJG8_9PEZI|nr:hypothetical protein K469DRAFT_720268 [Zopfia rhizophila CBS 207.26]